MSPVTIKFKLILQEVYQLKRGWDEEIFGELSTKWEKTLKSVENIGPRCIPRNYFYGGELLDATSIELHGFSDASGEAYAAVVYLRVTFSSRYVVSRFVALKTRVTR